jgi:hypothetical protein
VEKVRTPSTRYWVLAYTLIPFGVVTGFSIGIPILLLGLLLLVLSPVRHRAAIFWPIVIAYLVSVAGYILTAPSCSSFSHNGSPRVTTCSNLIGIEYSVGDSVNPSLGSALRFGLTAGLLVGVGLRVVLAHRQSATASGESQPLGM